MMTKTFSELAGFGEIQKWRLTQKKYDAGQVKYEVTRGQPQQGRKALYNETYSIIKY